MLRESTLLVVLAAIWLFFYWSTEGTFLTQRNLVLLALQTSIVSLAAISAVMLIVTRNFDLSVGSAVAFTVLAMIRDLDPAATMWSVAFAHLWRDMDQRSRLADEPTNEAISIVQA